MMREDAGVAVVFGQGPSDNDKNSCHNDVSKLKESKGSEMIAH